MLFAVVAQRFGATPMALVWMAFGAALLAAAAIDFDHRIIPDEISSADWCSASRWSLLRASSKAHRRRPPGCTP